MTLPTVIRIFFAIEIPQSMKDKLGNFISMLKKKSKTHAIRWTKKENLHITLHFLPEVRTDDLSRLIENVRKEMLDVEVIKDISIGTLQLFPHPYRPRVIVLDMVQQEKLTLVAEKVGRGIAATHYEIEKRPFRGHLTLGRIKHPPVNLQFLSEAPLFEGEMPLSFTEITLFRSEPQAEGSQYTVLSRIQLKELS